MTRRMRSKQDRKYNEEQKLKAWLAQCNRRYKRCNEWHCSNSNAEPSAVHSRSITGSTESTKYKKVMIWQSLVWQRVGLVGIRSSQDKHVATGQLQQLSASIVCPTSRYNEHRYNESSVIMKQIKSNHVIDTVLQI